MMSAAIANGPDHVTIRPDGHSLGRSGARISARFTTRVQVHLAGLAAEHLLTRRRSRELDREVGFAILARLDSALREAFADVTGRDGYRAVEEVLRMGVFASDDEIKNEIDRFYDITRESLTAVWSAVVVLAKALLEHDELDRHALEETLGNLDLFTPVVTVQRRHGLLTTLAIEHPVGH